MSIEEALRELDLEIVELDAFLAGLTASEWQTATPSEGWTIRDQVAHLADTNEIAVDTLTDGPRSLNVEAARYESPEAFTEAGCELGRSMTPVEVLEWWRTSSVAMHEAFLATDPKKRVPWGLGMQARTLVTARLMEHWAHGADIRAAVGSPVELSPRLRSVAWLVLNAIPYALAVAETPPPEGHSLRAVLDANGETWEIGPSDATDTIAGDALDFCLVGVQRKSAEAARLTADGALAELALPRLRAFL